LEGQNEKIKNKKTLELFQNGKVTRILIQTKPFLNSCDIHSWISWTIIKDVLFYLLNYNISTNINKFGVNSPTKTSLKK
jgi:hypothetical protein